MWKATMYLYTHKLPRLLARALRSGRCKDRFLNLCSNAEIYMTKLYYRKRQQQYRQFAHKIQLNWKWRRTACNYNLVLHDIFFTVPLPSSLYTRLWYRLYKTKCNLVIFLLLLLSSIFFWNHRHETLKFLNKRRKMMMMRIQTSTFLFLFFPVCIIFIQFPYCLWKRNIYTKQCK